MTRRRVYVGEMTSGSQNSKKQRLELNKPEAEEHGGQARQLLRTTGHFQPLLRDIVVSTISQ